MKKNAYPRGNSLNGRRHTRVHRAFHAYAVTVMLIVCLSGTAFAANDPLTVVNNMSNFVFSCIRAIGVIVLGWGLVQIGMSIQSHDASQRTQGFLGLFGGLIITFAKEILTAIGVS